jgi:hypothetical protein
MRAAAVAEMPTKDQFAKQVDKSFRTSAPSGQEFEMSLTEFRAIADSETQETFSLLFKAPADAEPEQGTYTISNPELGEQAIFLVPVDRNDKGLYFEAVYNRFKE